MINSPYKTLHLVLTHKWFDLIFMGHKSVEYRRATPYWQKRLEPLKTGDYLIFKRGYTKNQMARKFVSFKPITGAQLPEDVKAFFNPDPAETFYAIYLA